MRPKTIQKQNLAASELLLNSSILPEQKFTPAALFSDIDNICWIDSLLLLPLDDPEEQVSLARTHFRSNFSLQWFLNKRHLCDYCDCKSRDIDSFLGIYFSVVDTFREKMAAGMSMHNPLVLSYTTDAHDNNSEFPSHVIRFAVGEETDLAEEWGPIDGFAKEAVILTFLEFPR